MIKPQLALPIAAWLGVLALSQWREAKRLVISSGLVMAAFLVGSEILLRGWISRWVDATAAYARYTDSISMAVQVFGRAGGAVVNSALIAVVCAYLWTVRRAGSDSLEFAKAASLIFACTIAVSPVAHPYDGMFLLPAVALITQALLAQGLNFDKRVVLGSSLLVIASIWIFALLLAAAQLWAQTYTRPALMLMVLSMVLTPFAAVGGMLCVAYWSKAVSAVGTH